MRIVTASLLLAVTSCGHPLQPAVIENTPSHAIVQVTDKDYLVYGPTSSSAQKAADERLGCKQKDYLCFFGEQWVVVTVTRVKK